MRNAEPALHGDGRRRKSLVGRRSPQHDQVDRTCLHMRVGKRRTRRVQRKIGSKFAWRSNVPLANARTLHDPLIGGFDRAGQLVVAYNARRQIAATSEYDRTLHCHEPAPVARTAVLPAFKSRAIDWPILASNS